MLPPRFDFHRPASLEAAIALLAQHGDDASPYAGGTELLIALKARVARFAHLVDLKRIAELRGVAARADGGVSIGALSTHHELAHDALVRARVPGYAELSGNIANIRVRVAGTLGGNLCFAEPHADPPTMLCALGAEMQLASPRGRRTVALQDFIAGELTTARADDELLVRVEVPGQPQGTRAAYRAFGHLERPAVGVAAVAVPAASGFAWRLRAGGLCGRPAALAAAQQAMAGLPAQDALEALERHVEADAGGIEAHDDLQGSADYKRHLVTVLARRAARRALGLEERP
jgi:carbon-monoxide dehydrogenase medium subunit